MAAGASLYGLPVKALAQASGLSLGTNYNIVRTLIHEGYLVNEPNRLVLGSRFLSLCPDGDEDILLARVRNALRRVTEELPPPYTCRGSATGNCMSSTWWMPRQAPASTFGSALTLNV